MASGPKKRSGCGSNGLNPAGTRSFASAALVGLGVSHLVVMLNRFNKKDRE